MKRNYVLVSILMFLTLSIAAYSQSADGNDNRKKSNSYQTLLNNGNYVSRGFYFGMNFGHTIIADRNSATAGFNFALVLDHTLEIGIAGKGFISTPKPDPELYNNDYFYSGGYGGVYMAANIFGSKPINISIPVTIGWGGFAYSLASYNDYIDEYQLQNACSFFVVEPGIDIQFNMTKGFRLSAGVSYRYTSDIYMIFNNNLNHNVIKNSSLSGFNANLKFKLGRF